MRYRACPYAFASSSRSAASVRCVDARRGHQLRAGPDPGIFRTSAAALVASLGYKTAAP